MPKLFYTPLLPLLRTSRPITYHFIRPTTTTSAQLLRSQFAVTVIKRRAISSTRTTLMAKESTELKSNIIKFLYENNQRPVPTAEKDVVLTNCPHCIKVRKNSFAAYLNLQKGTYACKTCKSKGSFPEFSSRLLKKIKPEDSDAFSILSASNVLGKNGSNQEFVRSIEEIESYPRLLAQDSNLLKQLSTHHSITKETLDAYNVGVTKVDGRACLTFPQTTLTYDGTPTAGESEFKIDTVRLKLCDLENPETMIQMDPPMPNKEVMAGLFGYQTATSAESNTLILTRTELDAMAAFQETGIPAVSIPTSNYQLQESILPLIERFAQVYIWMDDDVDGQLAAERFAHKIGESKCSVVNTRQGNHQGPLNAHEALKERKNLSEIVASSKPLKHEQIIEFNDLRDEVYNEILYPEQALGVQSKDLPGLNNILKGHRSGELTILTGPTGAGKTTIISQLSLDYCKSGVPTLWGSFEIPNKRLAKKMLYQFACKDISQYPEEFDTLADRFEQLPLYFLKFFSSTAIKDVLKACHHAVYAYDIRHIVLDNLQFMLSQQARAGMDKWELQENAIAEIRQFATQQDVHVTLVVHPRKESAEELDINSIFGSAKVTQEADNVIIIQKAPGKVDSRSLDIKKNRFDGTLGTLPYKFDRSTHKILELTEQEILNSKKESFKRGSTSTIYRR